MKTVLLSLLKNLDSCTPEILEYIDNNYDSYIDELEAAYDILDGVLDDAIDAIETHKSYTQALANHVLTFDKETQTFIFDDHKYPAYWYRPGMETNLINENLELYREILHENPNAKYPLLEAYYPLKEWERELRWFLPEQNPPGILAKMEKDLESREGEDGETIYAVLSSGGSIRTLFNEYPRKLKKIVKVVEKHEENGLDIAILILKTRSNRQCTVEVSFTKDGSFRGMTALGRNGFPMFVEDDLKQIWQEVFNNEE